MDKSDDPVQLTSLQLPTRPRAQPSDKVRDDIALLGRVAARDEKALEMLYQRFGGPLFSLCLKMLGDRAEAEEALQDAFVRLWKRAPTYDSDRSAPFSWAVLITRSLCVDRLRSRRKIVSFTDEQAAESIADLAPEPDEGAEANDRARQIRDRLMHLPLEQRLCIEMAFFNGRTHQEIAEVLDEPLGTVKARIRRGLLKLRSLMS